MFISGENASWTDLPGKLDLHRGGTKDTRNGKKEIVKSNKGKYLSILLRKKKRNNKNHMDIAKYQKEK